MVYDIIIDAWEHAIDEEVHIVSHSLGNGDYNHNMLDIGDRIDAEYHEEMNKIIELTGAPESAYSTFLYVVQNMFSWDENGQGMYVRQQGWWEKTINPLSWPTAQ